MTSSRPGRKSAAHDIRRGFPAEAAGCDLIFCDPPYHTMLARQYSSDGIAAAPFSEWITFLHDFARNAFATLSPAATSPCCSAPRPKKTFHPDLAISITPF